MDTNHLDKYFSGQELYGDDFDTDTIKKWYQEEKEAYANLGSKNFTTYTYIYHAQNNIKKIRPTAVFYVLSKKNIN